MRDFPGSPVVKTLPSNAGGAGSIPGLGAKIPHALRPKNQNITQKQYCNKFNKDLKKIYGLNDIFPLHYNRPLILEIFQTLHEYGNVYTGTVCHEPSDSLMKSKTHQVNIEEVWINKHSTFILSSLC